ncbi:MAG: hypothetical protein M1839_004800 [Geoglossum umbratile]|nr:MAG: hypothetical protein M1839_004800 [Geoglossum umbratile]
MAESGKDTALLCHACKSLDLRFRDFPVAFTNRRTGEPNFQRVDTRLPLGTLQDMLQKKSCFLCRLVVRVLEAQEPGVTQRTTNRDPITLRETEGPITCSLYWCLKAAMDMSVPEQPELRSMMLGIECSSILRVHTYLVPRVESALAGGAETGQWFSRGRGSMLEKVGLASFWMHTCVGLHGAACKPTPIPKHRCLPKTITFVDVRYSCLVEQPLNCSYTALSYVQGNSPFFQNMESQASDLRLRQGLNGIQLPKTVKDAISLTQQLGMRYLWVSGLCVTQGNEESKRTLASMADVIFAGAVLTIVALDGADADAGLLAGRDQDQKWRARIGKGLTLSAVKTYCGIRERNSWTHETRAWTYQEMVLSRRLLIFADGLTFFVCRKANWREDLVTEGNETPTAFCPLLHMFMRDIEDEPYGHCIPDTYAGCVAEYTRRKMTHASDALNAFAGLSRVLESQMRTTLRFGLPVALMDWALLFRPGKTIRPRPGFPSWVWAGWEGGVELSPSSSADFMIFLCSHTWIEFYLDDEALGCSIHLSTLDMAREAIPTGSSSRGRYQDYFRKVLMAYVETSTHNPLKRFPDIQFQTVPTRLGPAIQSGLLRFFTISALFELEAQKAAPETLLPNGLQIKDRSGNRAGFLHLGSEDSDEEMKTLGGAQEIILLSERFGEHRIRFPGEPDPWAEELQIEYGVSDNLTGPELLRLIFSGRRSGEGQPHSLPQRLGRGEEEKGAKEEGGEENGGGIEDEEGEGPVGGNGEIGVEEIEGDEGEEGQGDDTDSLENELSCSTDDEFPEPDRMKLKRLRDPANWTLYNVMAIKWEGGLARRIAVGWLHREALDGVDTTWKEIVLG